MDKPQIYQQKEYAKGYDDDRYGGEFGQYLHDLDLNTFLSLMDLSYINVLDVGAGTGKISIPLAVQSRHVVAVDSSEEMIKILSMKAKKGDVQLETIICDAHRLCFDDKAFDCAVSSRLSMHLDDWRKAISELCRISAVATIIDFPPCLSFAGLSSVLRNIKCFFIPTIQTYKTFYIKDVVDQFHKHDFGIEVSFLAMGWIRCVLILISMIPISIAGLGIREGSLILLLRPFGTIDEEGLAFSLLVFAVSVVLVGLIGSLIGGKNLFRSKFSR
jgi:2-polyprenyl-3-methyl-5-hydroxy-6-metoxy-1,4-benzoquinol methylase